MRIERCVALTIAIAAVVPGFAEANHPALEAWSMGRFEAAAAAARARLSTSPHDAPAHQVMALVAFTRGNHEEGLEHFRAIPPGTHRDELNPIVRRVFESLGQFDQAIAVAREEDAPPGVIDALEQQASARLQVALEATTVIEFSPDHLIARWMPAIPIEINGRAYLGHLDTGGAFVHMAPKMAAELGIDTVPYGRGVANARETDLGFGLATTLQLGDAVLRNVPTVTVNSLEGALSDGEGNLSDLIILGTNVLERFLTTWDTENQRLVLSPRHDAEARRVHFDRFLSKTAAPTEFYMVPDHFLVAHGAIAGQDATFFVDTGLVTVDATGRQPGLAMSAAKVAQFSGESEEAISEGLRDAPGAVRLGSVTLDDQGISVSSNWERHSFAGIEVDALLSYGFLKHCTWTIDFDTRTWYLDACAATDTAPPIEREFDPVDFAGHYEVTPGVTLEVTTTDGDLYLQAPGQQRIALVAQADGSFAIPLAGARIVFQRDPEVVIALVLEQAGVETRAVRRGTP